MYIPKLVSVIPILIVHPSLLGGTNYNVNNVTKTCILVREKKTSKCNTLNNELNALFNLTNKKASTVLCCVVKHAGSG